jgi:hypothetical protein
MPEITVMVSGPHGNARQPITVPLCPDCRGTGKVITRYRHSLRIYLRRWLRCKETA